MRLVCGYRLYRYCCVQAKVLTVLSQGQHSVKCGACLQPYLTKAEAWRNGAQVRPCRSLVGRLDADSK